MTEGELYQLQNLPMTLSVARKWGKWGKDAKITLCVAFYNAISRPEMVAEFSYYSCRHAGRLAEICQFRIGYAVFRLAIFDGDQIVVIGLDLLDESQVEFTQQAAE